MVSQSNTNDECKINLHFIAREEGINRSYARILGRLSPAKQRLMIQLPEWLILPENCDQEGEYHLDIGFGMGDSLLSYAQNHHIPCIGIDVYLPGLLSVMQQAQKLNVSNIKMIHGDVLAILPRMPKRKAKSIFVLFADPWPKKKQRKRRLIQASFLKQLAALMNQDGSIWIATDCEQYADHIESILDLDTFSVKRNERLPIGETKYQKRAKKLGHQVFTWRLGVR
ncbi:MAG: tRNA (guanine(46)-N(7))-methyltransferase TrmB [Candidatus Comchoanobacterales bacterium]